MNINHHNYEEFFLLYIDGELNSNYEQMVETFLQNNPDLQDEFNMLLDTKLEADEVSFDKSALYKNEATAINSSNYEEKFLLYVDNELTASTKANVETFVLQNPALQTEFTLLKNCILPNETIVCPNKESLYKKEEKPVVFMWVKRLSVAAAFLLFAVMAWMLSNNTNTTVVNKTSVAVSTKNNEKNIGTPVTSGSTQPLNTETTATTTNNNKMSIAIPNEQQVVSKQFVNNIGMQTQNKVVETVVINKKEETIASTQQSNSVQKNNEIAGVINTTVQTENPMNVVVKNTDVANNTVKTVHKQAPVNTVQTIVYKTLEEDDDMTASNNTVYVGNMQLNKNKVDGLMKKAKGLFAKSKKQIDDGTQTAISNTL
jgi:anti-sigma factor RsiW